MFDLRVGNGLDFHKLESNPDRPLILGGFVIPGEWALVGHSDADLVLHAISDAIYGALAMGDIGTHFPDTDPSLKNMDSRRIIGSALRSMEERGFGLMNMDITIIGERPKISPHREQISESLALLLGISADRIGVKATTTEKMGALGRKEGVGCLATVLLFKRNQEPV